MNAALHKVKTLQRRRGCAMAVASGGEREWAWMIGLAPYPMLCHPCRARMSSILHPWDSKSFFNVLFSDCVFNQSFNIYSKSDLAVSSVVSYPERSREGQYAIYVSPSLKR